MKQLTHVLEERQVIRLKVPTCLKDCPYCHDLACHEDKSNVKPFTMQDRDIASVDGFPEWCPLPDAEGTYVEYMNSKLQEQGK